MSNGILYKIGLGNLDTGYLFIALFVLLLICVILLTIFGFMAYATDGVSSNLNLPTY